MCDCLKQTNAVLHEQKPNHTISATMPWRKGDISKVIILAPRDIYAPKGTARDPISIIANYCPFCGEKYPEKENS